MDLSKNQNKQFSKKDIPNCGLTRVNNLIKKPKNINYNKQNSNNNINHINNNNSNNKNNNNNNNPNSNNKNLLNSNTNSFLKSFSNSNVLKDSGYTSDNSSDINFSSSSSSLKDQILSPGDDDLYLYLNNNKNQNPNNNQKNIYYNNNNNLYTNNNNQNNDFDYNYYLNFKINNNFKTIDSNNKKILILDLDETLVHSSFHPLFFNNEVIQPDIFFKILFENKSHDVYVLKRPYIKEFLNKMNKIFTLYIFTASIKEYANPLLQKLDKHKLISKKLFRENCTLSQDNKYIKDLSILNENLKNVILLDNNPNSYRFNKCNGLPIKTWHFDKTDKELIKIIPFLTFLSMVDDVRKYIPQVVEGDQLNYYKINNMINNINLKDIIKKENHNKKKLLNKVKKSRTFNNNNNNNINFNHKNNNYSTSVGKVKYNPCYTNDEEKNCMKKREYNLSNNINKIDKFLNEDENNKFFASQINYNFMEEKKIGYNAPLSNKNSFHNPATINFREPSSHFSSSIFIGNKSKITNKNKMMLSNENNNIYNSNNNYSNNNNLNKYQRSKSSNNFNELSGAYHKFSSINFNLANSQSNTKIVKYSADLKHKQNNNNENNINNNKEIIIKQIYQNKNMTTNYLPYNYLKNNLVNFKKNENALYLENNDPVLITYNNNNNTYNDNIINNNNNNSNNIKNVNLINESSKQNLYKQVKNKDNIQKNDSNYNARLLNKYKSTTNQNIFKNKNVLYKKRLNENEIFDNNKYEETKQISKIKEKNNNYDDSNTFLDNKKYNNYRSNKKIKTKINSFRNTSIHNSKNISLSKTNEINNKSKVNNGIIKYNIINNNKNDNLNIVNKNYLGNNEKYNIENNKNNINQKKRSSTLNEQHNSYYNKISLNVNFEENKNSTLEVSKTTKKIKDNNIRENNINMKMNYHNHNNKYYNNNQIKNLNMNYNKYRQKIINQKNNLNNDLNLLNMYMDEENKKEEKEMIYFPNYQIMNKEMNTQRLPKVANLNKKNISPLINYHSEKYLNRKIETHKNEIGKNRENIDSKNEMINKQNVDYYDKENFYANFYQRKNKPYLILRDSNNYMKKKMKNNNLDEYYENEIKIENNNNSNDSDYMKNIKYISLKKEENMGKNMNYQKMYNNQKFINNNGKISHSGGWKKK